MAAAFVEFVVFVFLVFIVEVTFRVCNDGYVAFGLQSEEVLIVG